MELELRKINLVPENDPVLFISPTVWDFDNPQFDPKQFNILMLENMVVHEGLGLSANQIGIPFQVFGLTFLLNFLFLKEHLKPFLYILKADLLSLNRVE